MSLFDDIIGDSPFDGDRALDVLNEFDDSEECSCDSYDDGLFDGSGDGNANCIDFDDDDEDEDDYLDEDDDDEDDDDDDDDEDDYRNPTWLDIFNPLKDW